MPRSRTAMLLLGGLVASAQAAGAQTVEDVLPLEPAWRATVGPRPVFKIGVEGTDLDKIHLRLVMSRDDFHTEMYVFSQMEEPNGWAQTSLAGEFGAIFTPPKPLENGRYQWRADAWNGLNWVEGDEYSEVDIDSVPPAGVEGLVMHLEPEGAGIVLEWDQVTIDENGHPEWVEKYHIYRYIRRSFFFAIRPFEIAVTDETRFVDRDEVALVTPLVFYKINAEDQAGNESDQTY